MNDFWIFGFVHFSKNPKNSKNIHTCFWLILTFFSEKIGLRITGTVRKDRIGTIKNKLSLDKNAVRGEYQVQNEKNSGMNYVLDKDNKDVMHLSIAASVVMNSQMS